MVCKAFNFRQQNKTQTNKTKKKTKWFKIETKLHCVLELFCYSMCLRKKIFIVRSQEAQKFANDAIDWHLSFVGIWFRSQNEMQF